MGLNDFSGGYYSMQMQIQPYSDGPVIDADVYDYINREVYSKTDAPITMKLSMDNGAYFNVDAENGVPPSVLALPEAWVDNFVDDDGRRSRVFVLKPGHSYLMHQSELLEERFADTSLEDFSDD
jgi:hypothetical protein